MKLSSLRSLSKHTLFAQELSDSAIKPYGQVIEWCEDGVPFGPTDAELCTSNETPRLYVMRLRGKELRFDQITYHAKVTQCLGSFQQNSWYLALATPTWTVEKYPKPTEISVFKIPAGRLIKLNKGTWHAGPFFTEEYMDFINFELRDTNISDHNSHDYSKDDITFLIQDQK